MEPGIYAYFVEADAHTPDSVRDCLAKLGLDQVLLRLRPLQISGQELLMLELRDLNTGSPLDLPGLGVLLAEGERSSLFAAVDPTGEGAALEVYKWGEEQLSWSGPWDSFEHEGQRGRDGFHRTFTRLTEMTWDDLVQVTGELQHAEDADEHETELLLRGRALGLPAGMPAWPGLFRVHYVEEEADDADDPDAADDAAADGRMMLVLLDLELSGRLWQEMPAAEVGGFLRAIEPLRGTVLGPLAHALPDAVEMIRAQLPDRPLATSPIKELLPYEVLSMATAVGYLSGDTVEFYDRFFFPLLCLTDAPVAPDAVQQSLEEIREMGVLSAMVEVLPYSAPEGELLECFGDDELSPLAEWALADDGVYEGSLFRLDPASLRQRVERFDGQALRARVEEFRKVWADQLPPGNEWHAGELELDEAELADFEQRLEELRMWLALSAVNKLQPAVLFYGD